MICSGCWSTPARPTCISAPASRRCSAVDGELVPRGPPAAQRRAARADAPEHHARRASSRSIRESGDTDWAYEIDGLARFRCNAGRDRHGPMAVFRVIPTSVRTADEMGLSREVQNLCYLTKGLVVVTGPTGSGKSTTLAALVDLINRTRTDHIITIEDPIEFVHQSKKCLVTQRQVGVHTRSFKHALRAALREDPDIILVGEMRDLETVSIAIETAETGHLVFGTLHTTTAASTIDRIIDQFPARPAVAGAGDALGIAARRHRADALQEDRRRARGRAGDPAHHPRGVQPDPRGKDVPDPVGDADQPEGGHGHAQRRADGAGGRRSRWSRRKRT